VHVLDLRAYKRRVRLGLAAVLAAHLGRVRFLHRLTNTMQHEPCRLLGDASATRNLVRRDAIFAVGNHPSDHHPLVEGQSGVLKDRPNLEAELLLASIAFPDAASLDECMFLRSAAGTRDQTVRPAIVDGIGESAVFIGEVNDGFLKCLRVFHDVNVRFYVACVKYVIAEILEDVQLVHAHICPACGRAARREDMDGMPDAAGVFHCSRCGHEGPLNDAVIEERDERLQC
jgi:predicted RNA-binding Zn-ribbon protein involved in translation (DUF1610 family)